MNERGSVLGQVLVLAAVAGLMCATMLRARLQPALTAARATDRVQGDLLAQAAVNRVTAVWSYTGTCGSSPKDGVTCVGEGCDCRCRVASAGDLVGGVRVRKGGAGAACVLEGFAGRGED